MKRLLMRAALLGTLAVAGVTVGGTSAFAQNCIGAGGGTDCPLTPGVPQVIQPDFPNPNRQPDVRPDRGWDDRSGWDRHDRQRWRNGWNRRHNDRVYIDRVVPVYPPSYYDDDYYYDRPRYRSERPRYRVRDLSNAHVEWCYDRYKTYRASDNTYKPTKNTRRQCISPYS